MCECVTERQMLEVYRKQVQYDPNEMYSHRFLPKRDVLDKMGPEAVIYDLQPYMATKEAYDTHMGLGNAYDNFDLQFKQDHINGLKYIEGKVPIPSIGEGYLVYPRISGNPTLVPPDRSMYNKPVQPPAPWNAVHVTGIRKGYGM